MRSLHVDACVIGTGAGGGPVAKELAEGGLSVAILEEGRRVDPAELTARPRDMLASLYRDAGPFTTIGNPPIVLPLGRAVGGSTLINSGTCFRTPDHVLERWVTEDGLDALGPRSLDPYFERVEEEIGVAEVPAALAGRNAAIARRGAEALGWSGGFLKRNAPGCPSGAKQHMGATYVPSAERAGAILVTGARATRIATRRGHAGVVEAITREGPMSVRADLVVVAAGTMHTPGLLAASGLGGASGRLGRNLSIHPATAVWALMDEEVDMARGVPQSYYVDEFAREGIMMEGVAGPPDYLAVAAPFTGPRHRKLMLEYRRVAQFGAMISDTSRGWIAHGRLVRRAGRTVVRYDLNAQDAATAGRAIERLVELFWAAGAHTVLTPLAKARELRHGERPTLRDVRPGQLKLMAFHPLGTARASASPSRGVVDEDGRVHGTDNVYVADGSAVPTALGVNPQITIMALATRLAFHLLGKPVPHLEEAV